MRKTYIADGLKQYLNEKHQIWHMPGHKRKAVFEQAGDIGSRLDSIYAYDVTEVPGTDDLYEPEDFIDKSLQQLKKLYGTCGSYYIVNGSTGGIFAAIYACTSPGDAIIVARNCHKSVYNAANVFGLKTVVTETGITGIVCPEEIERLCAANPNVTAIVITSPTYEGVVSDIKAISQIAKKYNKYVIADEAHGAHLPFISPELSAITLGADLVVQSLHKTLPALTQTALLHVCKKELLNKAQRSISMFMSSSPSYIMMLSMERAVCFAADKDCREYMESLGAFRRRCKTFSNIRILEAEKVKAAHAFGYDETRLVFFSDIPGTKLMAMLDETGGIVCEMAGEKHVVLISTIVDTKKDFEHLYEALKRVDAKLNDIEKMGDEKGHMLDGLADEEYWRKRIGTKAKQPIYVYPPGSYIVQADEIITEKAVEKILALKKSGLKIRE